MGSHPSHQPAKEDNKKKNDVARRSREKHRERKDHSGIKIEQWQVCKRLPDSFPRQVCGRSNSESSRNDDLMKILACNNSATHLNETRLVLPRVLTPKSKRSSSQGVYKPTPKTAEPSCVSRSTQITTVRDEPKRFLSHPLQMAACTRTQQAVYVPPFPAGKRSPKNIRRFSSAATNHYDRYNPTERGHCCFLCFHPFPYDPYFRRCSSLHTVCSDQLLGETTKIIQDYSSEPRHILHQRNCCVHGNHQPDSINWGCSEHSCLDSMAMGPTNLALTHAERDRSDCLWYMQSSTGRNRNVSAGRGAAGDAIKYVHETATAAAGDEVSIHSNFSAASAFSTTQKPITVFTKDLTSLRKFLEKVEKESKG